MVYLIFLRRVVERRFYVFARRLAILAVVNSFAPLPLAGALLPHCSTGARMLASQR